MFNLLRMDFYRIKRSKSVYVCLLTLLLFTAASCLMIWMMATPQGLRLAARLNIIPTDVNSQVLGNAADSLAQVDTLKMFRQLGISGGMYSLILGIWVMLFVCGDYQSGFIKNVMSLHQNRWNYVGSKILAAGAVNLCYLLLQYAWILALNRLFGNMTAYADIRDIAFFMAWTWLLTTAFCALLTAVCILTRSVAAATAAAILLGSGTIVAALQGILDMLHLGGWLQYTIYLTLSTGPSRYASLADLQVFAVGGGFLILYTFLAGLILKRQDI